MSRSLSASTNSTAPIHIVRARGRGGGGGTHWLVETRDFERSRKERGLIEPPSRLAVGAAIKYASQAHRGIKSNTYAFLFGLFFSL